MFRPRAVFWLKKFELKALPDSSLYVNEISFKPPGASSSVNNKGPPQWTLKAFSFAFNGSRSLLSILIIPPDFIPAANLTVVGRITPPAVLPAFYCLFLRPQSPRGEENKTVPIIYFIVSLTVQGQKKGTISAYAFPADVLAEDDILYSYAGLVQEDYGCQYRLTLSVVEELMASSSVAADAKADNEKLLL